MNWITILGIVFLAIGTLMTIYGPLKESKEEGEKDKAELNNKLDQFGNKIERILQEDLPLMEKEEKIAEIQNEYTNWAAEFTNNFDQYKLDYQKNHLGLEEKKINVSKKWRPLYVNFFTQLEDLIKAYNEIPDRKNVEIIHKNNIPINIFNANSDNFFYTIKFDDKTFWSVRIINREHFNENNIPAIIIGINDKNRESSFGTDLIIIPNIQSNRLDISKTEKMSNAYLKDNYPLDSYENSNQDILKIIFPFQILKLELQ